jgi:hypothetical protein
MARRYKAQDVADAITKSKGMITYAAKMLGCNRSTVHSYVNNFEVCREAVDDARAGMLDNAELQLANQIQDGNITAIIFYLKTIGKHRGYIERHDIGLAISPDTMKLANELGISESDIVREFEALIRAEAEKISNSE